MNVNLFNVQSCVIGYLKLVYGRQVLEKNFHAIKMVVNISYHFYGTVITVRFAPSPQ